MLRCRQVVAASRRRRRRRRHAAAILILRRVDMPPCRYADVTPLFAMLPPLILIAERIRYAIFAAAAVAAAFHYCRAITLLLPIRRCRHYEEWVCIRLFSRYAYAIVIDDIYYYYAERYFAMPRVHQMLPLLAMVRS